MAREAAYYQVNIPCNTPSWRVKLEPTVGEALLVIQKDYLPNVISGGLAAYAYGTVGGIKMQKAGYEHYLLLPSYYGTTNISAGNYYQGVVSQGVNPSGGNIGSNSTSYVLSSLGSLTVTNLGTVGTDDLLITNALEAADVA